MSLANYLFKRPNSQYWQLRWMVPKEAREAVGRSEFTKSLGVTDRHAASRLAFPYLAQWEAQVNAALATRNASSFGQREATNDELNSLLVESYEADRAFHKRWARLAVRQGIRSFAEQRRECEGTADYLQQKAFLGDVEDHFPSAVSMLAHRGLRLPTDEGSRADFGKRSVIALRDAIRSVAAEMDAGADSFQPAEFLRVAKTRKVVEAAPGETIMELFDRYAAQRSAEQRKRADTLTQDRKIVQEFAFFVGDRKALRAISAEDVRAWRDAIECLPPVFRKRKENRALAYGKPLTVQRKRA